LRDGVQQIGAGNLKLNLPIHSGDEFEFLAHEFYKMAEKLAQHHDHLDQEVQERTKELLKANRDLEKTQEQVQSLSQELLKIQETERQQISLDLHDNVAQELSSLKVAGESIFDELEKNDPQLQNEVTNWVKQLDRCIKKVRELSYNLRPPGLGQMGLANTLADFCRTFSQQTGIEATFSQAGVEGLQLKYNYAITIYRLVQEGLNNIKNHAQTTKASIKLIASHPYILLRIEDQGVGFDLDDGYHKVQKNKRLGLLGMQERVRMLNGTFKIHSAPQQGTKILIEFPIDKDHEEKNSNN